ncbi:hypothetical protein [Shinella zoogloeoides]|uniref:hypothetical protein n=1 Tax=Shinella zoogloeoides TaxID=352475 RepID=UPI00273D939B|nr:hypothetical protein [Shinella zoogloeoides]WLR91626.1 hypothetical protein Q9316_14110 [Shinella zoogloeoides]
MYGVAKQEGIWLSVTQIDDTPLYVNILQVGAITPIHGAGCFIHVNGERFEIAETLDQIRSKLAI